MTRRAFPLEANGPERVEIITESPTTKVLVDGVLLHTFDDLPASGRGAELTLTDGSLLSVRNRGFSGIELRRNGVPLPGSDFDRPTILRLASRWLFWVGAAGFASDAFALYRHPGAGPAHTYAKLHALACAVFLGLAWLTRRGARWAIAVALGLVALGHIAIWSVGVTDQSPYYDLFIGALLLSLFRRSADVPYVSPSPHVSPAVKRRTAATGWPSRDDDQAGS